MGLGRRLTLMQAIRGIEILMNGGDEGDCIDSKSEENRDQKTIK